MGVDEVFDAVVLSRVFRAREKLLPDYIPEELPHRDLQIRRVAETLAPALRGERPSNLFIYGLTGTGKTAVVKHVVRRLTYRASRLGVVVSGIYINVRHRDTPYRVLADIAESIGVRVPFTGLSTGEVFYRIVRALRRRGGIYIIILDEIDFLVRRYGDDVLYKLVRINEDLGSSRVSLVGITNSVSFIESLDPRVKSSLGEEEIVFPPYNASQLRDILEARAREAFNPGVLDEEVIPLCAALAAREHGDARRALDLLRVSGEIAERRGSGRVTREHVMAARMEIERDRVSEVVKTLPLHGKLVLAAITALTMGGRVTTTTGDVYSYYKDLTARIGIEHVTSRRVSGLIGELEMLGIVSARVISRGRYGKTRVIGLLADPAIIVGSLWEDPALEPVMDDVERDALGKGGSGV
ncbi:MAG: orc1/cdc6 family replication initiation protein [Desulfurococcales archaeon]|nr:orc1/cdc6 family replication initiation protein [Desulfurococcales archaeon]